MTEYSIEYAKILANGYRLEGASIIDFCLHCKILYSDYLRFIKEDEFFRYSAELGDMHYSEYWYQQYKMHCIGIKKGEGTQLQFAMKNLPIAHWVDKKEPEEAKPEPPTDIRITVLPPRDESKDDQED